MRQKSGPQESAEQHIKTIRRATRKKYSTEEKIRVVMSGLRGEYSVAELCRREGIASVTDLGRAVTSPTAESNRGTSSSTNAAKAMIP